MSVLLYNPRFNWEQKRVSSKEVLSHLLDGWFLVPYSAIKESEGK